MFLKKVYNKIKNKKKYIIFKIDKNICSRNLKDMLKNSIINKHCVL